MILSHLFKTDNFCPAFKGTFQNLHIQVSIDGDTAEVHDRMRGVRGAFDKAIGAVRTLLEEGVRTKVCTTATTSGTSSGSVRAKSACNTCMVPSTSCTTPGISGSATSSVK